MIQTGTVGRGALIMACLMAATITIVAGSFHEKCSSSSNKNFRRSCDKIKDVYEKTIATIHFEHAIECGCGLLAQDSVNLYYRSLFTSELKTLGKAIEEAFVKVPFTLANEHENGSKLFKKANMYDRIRFLKSYPIYGQKIVDSALEYFLDNYYSPETGKFEANLQASSVRIKAACKQLTAELGTTLGLLSKVAALTQSDSSLYNLISVDQDLLQLVNLSNFCKFMAPEHVRRYNIY